MMSTYGHLDNVMMIGFGSIGRGTLPPFLRHFDIEPNRITVLAPNDDNDTVLEDAGVTRVDAFLTPDNYAEVLEPLLAPGTFVVNQAGTAPSTGGTPPDRPWSAGPDRSGNDGRGSGVVRHVVPAGQP